MLDLIAPSRAIYEWPEIIASLKPAIERDPKANPLDMLGMVISGQMSIYRGRGPSGGFLAVEVQRLPGTLRKAMVIVYAGRPVHGRSDMRGIIDTIELYALKARCSEVRFEGRAGWRRVFPDYQARQVDGRWKYRKALT